MKKNRIPTNEDILDKEINHEEYSYEDSNAQEIKWNIERDMNDETKKYNLINAAERVNCSVDKYVKGEAERLSIEESYFEQEDNSNIERDMNDETKDFNMFNKTPKGNCLLKNNFQGKLSEDINTLGRVKEGNIFILIENYIDSKFNIIKIDGKLYVKKGYYIPLDKDKFIELLRGSLPYEVQNKMKTFKVYEDVYEFILHNPKYNLKNMELEIERGNNFIPFENGLFDCVHNELIDKDVGPYIFFQPTVKYIENGSTKYFDLFIESQSGGEEEYIVFIYEIIAFILMQGITGKKIIVLGEASNSGKTTFGRLLKSFYETEYVKAYDIYQLSEQFALGALGQTKLNVQMEANVELLKPKNIITLKKLSGEPFIETQEKYGRYMTSLNLCKMVFGTNTPLSLTNVKDNNALWNRILAVPFMNEIRNEDKDDLLLEKILQEKNAIASKAALYAQNLIQNNFEFTVPNSSTNLKQKWMKKEDSPFAIFIGKYCRVTYDDNDFIAVSELVDKYTKYMFAAGLFQDINRNDIKKYLKDIHRVDIKRKYPAGYTNAVSCFVGIKYL